MKIDRLLESRETQFWILQLLGWTAWGLTFYFAAVVWGSHQLYIHYIPMATTAGLLISLGLRFIYRFSWHFRPRYRVAIALLAPVVAGVLWRLTREYIFGHVYINEEKLTKIMEGWDQVFLRLPDIIAATMVMLCWTGLYFGIKYYRLFQEAQQRGLRTEAMAHESQLKMLRYQLNPHFLFNTLNAISTLILDKENKLANTMVTGLSHFLRYSLDNDPMQKVTLSQELEAMQLYLEIEKVRFAERLRLEFEIEKAAEKALIPSLLLQPLIENAMKYAVAYSVNGGTVRVAARVFAGELLLEVGDDGPGLEHSSSRSDTRQGLGLANTRSRLQELYGNNQSFRLGTTDPHGVTAYIRLPYETSASG